MKMVKIPPELAGKLLLGVSIMMTGIFIILCVLVIFAMVYGKDLSDE